MKNIIFISSESRKYRKIQDDESLDEIVYNLTDNINGKYICFLMRYTE